MNRDVIKKIVFLPHEFYTRGNISMVNLLHEIDFFLADNLLKNDDIYKVVVEHPECIIGWLDWSENKRAESGWFFKQKTDKMYSVGYYSKEKVTEQQYNDIAEACAVFIKCEVEEIKNS